LPSHYRVSFCTIHPEDKTIKTTFYK
jgi:hypothetical protein